MSNTKRGFVVIGLERPRDPLNVGSVVRAAGCFGADTVVISGGTRKVGWTDTMKMHRHIPILYTDDDEYNLIPALFDPDQVDCVAVELTDEAESLVTFNHPERAVYIFGPENGSVSPNTIRRCKYTVKIPTNRCMNLAATVNVVLYDRLAKLQQKQQESI